MGSEIVVGSSQNTEKRATSPAENSLEEEEYFVDSLEVQPGKFDALGKKEEFYADNS